MIFGGIPFPTKVSVKSHCRSIFSRWPDGRKIDGNDDKFLRDLILNHPHAAEKIGAGISMFSIHKDSMFGNSRHFVLHRLDQTYVDFSYHVCLDGISIRGNVMAALRFAISGQILDFSNRYWDDESLPDPTLCPLTGLPITRHRCHVDHQPPNTFSNLARQWMEANNLELSDIVLSREQDYKIGVEMGDPLQKQSWQKFHHAKATLRVLSPEANLQLSSP